MPLDFDLTLDELTTYDGASPRPEKFDEFWDAGLRELGDTPAETEIARAEFQAPFAACSDLWFTGTGNAGSRVHAKLIQPNTDTPGPALVVYHGYSGDGGDWTWLLHFAAAGFTVASIDVRGQGGISDDRDSYSGMTLESHVVRGLDDALDGHPERLFYRNVFLDCARLAQIVMDLPGVDASRVAAYGGSQGGALTTVAAALEPRIVRAYADFPFLSDYRRVWSMSLDMNPYSEIRNWFKRHDPMHDREDEVFGALGYIDIQFLAPRITAAYTMAVGLEDMICPPSSQFAIYNKITADKKLWIYPDFGHESLPGAGDRMFTELVDAFGQG